MPDLESLYPALRRRAGRYAYGGLEADDVAQEMALALLSAKKHDGAYLMRRASWAGSHVAFSIRTYRRYVDVMPQAVDESGEPVDYAEEMLADAAPSPEAQLISKERMAELRARLTPQQERLVNLLLTGYQAHEIAPLLGITPGSVTQRLSTLRRQLAGWRQTL